MDLERRSIVDVLSDRCTASMSRWLKEHPTVEVVSRDRCGLYARAARQALPHARQVADRFHLVQNLRFAIEKQLSRSPQLLKPNSAPRIAIHSREPTVTETEQALARKGRRHIWLARFAEVKRLQQAGKTLGAIITETGLNWRTVAKWTKCDSLPERRRMDPRPRNPTQFADYLAKRWIDGCRNGRHLLLEIRKEGYPGSRAQLERLLYEWRRNSALPAAQLAPGSTHDALGVMTVMPPVAASMLCVTPRTKLTARQAGRIDLLKEHLPGFADLRQLAMRFRGILRSKDPTKLVPWLADVRRSGFLALRRFAQILERDINAVRNAISDEWSNGQTEGQINKLKTLKRSMYGHAGAELLRARMLPVSA